MPSTITRYNLKINRVGDDVTVINTNTAVSLLTDNLDAPATPVTVDPQFLYWSDPNHPSKYIRWQISAQVGTLAPGFYYAGIQAVAGTLLSPWSLALNFEKLGPPDAPTGLVFA